jgi:predicted metal-dependent hydrolase
VERRARRADRGRPHYLTAALARSLRLPDAVPVPSLFPRAKPLPLPEEDSVTLGADTISYRVTRSARRKKTIAIAIAPDGSVRVAAPLRVPAQAIRDLVTLRGPWILARSAALAAAVPPPRLFVTGETLPLRGEDVPLIVHTGSARSVRITFASGQFAVVVPTRLEGESRTAAIRAAFLRWYRERAIADIAAAVARRAPEMGVAPTRVIVRDQRRRWGSCAPDGSLRFNWRLVLADPALLDYVVVHELAHLQQRNHSPAFWAVVERALPGYRPLRHHLNRLGPALEI